MKITKPAPVGGFCAESAGAITLFLATRFGIPVSTTQTITGAIIGVGTVRKLSAVRWGVAGRVLGAWIFTVPGAAAISAATFWLLQACGLPVKGARSVGLQTRKRDLLGERSRGLLRVSW